MKKITLLMCCITAVFIISCKKDNNSSGTTPQPATLLYYTDYTDSLFGKIDLKNGNTLTTILKGIASGIPAKGLLGIDYNASTGDIFLSIERSGAAAHIYKLTSGGVLTSLFDNTDGVDYPTGLIYNSANNKLYWLNTGDNKIYVGNADGSGTPVSLFGSTSIEASGYGFAIDQSHNKLYYSNWDEIFVGNLNGTGTPTILYGVRPDTIESPSSLLLDVPNNRIYWTDENADVVAYANLDGTGNFKILYNNPHDGVSRSDGLAIDKVSGKIYWSETGSANRIRVANLDGSGNIQTVADGPESYILKLR